jgi:hypothetical protein
MEPFIFNANKHHLATIAQKIREFAQQGEALQEKLLEEILPGEGVVDIYDGKLSVADLEGEVFLFLQKNNILAEEAYKTYLETHGDIKRHGHYLCLTLSDGSIVTLRRMGFYEVVKDPRYFVHVHPARHSPHTFRVPTNRLKTAIMIYFVALCQKGSSGDLSLINQARAKIGLCSIPEIPEPIAVLVQKLERA